MTHTLAASAGLFYWWVLVPAYPPHASTLGYVQARLALGAAAASVLSFAFRFPEPWFQVAFLTGRPLGELVIDPLVAQLISETRFGRLWAIEQGVSLSLAGLLSTMALRTGENSRSWTLATAAGLLLASLPALGGHAASHSALGLLNHILHFVAASVWLGGLFHLLLLGSSLDRMAAAVKAFSPAALTALVVALASGAVNAWLYIPELSYITGSRYGMWLGVKLVFVVGLLGLAAYNGLVAGPSLEQSRRGRPSLTAARFRRSLLLEGVAGALVLSASQRLAHQPPVYRYSFEHLGLTGRFAPGLAGFHTALGLVLVTIGIVVAARSWFRSRAAVGAGVAIAVAGAAAAAYSLLLPTTPWTAMENPVPRMEATLRIGERVYTAHCSGCHGPQGRGDGPLAPSLPRPPADLTAGRTALRTDGDIMWVITEGHGGVDAPSLRTLSETERWSAVHYVRVLQERQRGASDPRRGP